MKECLNENESEMNEGKRDGSSRTAKEMNGCLVAWLVGLVDLFATFCFLCRSLNPFKHRIKT